MTELERAVYGLLDFIADKYNVETVEGFTCPHHQKLARLVKWSRRDNQCFGR